MTAEQNEVVPEQDDLSAIGLDKRAYNWQCPKACGQAIGGYNKCKRAKGRVDNNCLCNSRSQFRVNYALCKKYCSSGEVNRYRNKLAAGARQCRV